MDMLGCALGGLKLKHTLCTTWPRFQQDQMHLQPSTDGWEPERALHLHPYPYRATESTGSIQELNPVGAPTGPDLI